MRQLPADSGVIGTVAGDGGGFYPTGFVSLMGLQSDSGEHLVEQHAGGTAEKMSGQTVFGGRANADNHDFRRPDRSFDTRQAV